MASAARSTSTPWRERGYLVVYNTDAQDAKQNTRRFNIELRDYLIDHFFAPRRQ